MTLVVLCKMCEKSVALNKKINNWLGFCWSCEIKLRTIKRKHKSLDK